MVKAHVICITLTCIDNDGSRLIICTSSSSSSASTCAYPISTFGFLFVLFLSRLGLCQDFWEVERKAKIESEVVTRQSIRELQTWSRRDEEEEGGTGCFLAVRIIKKRGWMARSAKELVWAEWRCGVYMLWKNTGSIWWWWWCAGTQRKKRKSGRWGEELFFCLANKYLYYIAARI